MRSPQVIELITCLICSCIVATSPSILFNIRKSVEALGQGQTLEIPPGTYNSSNCDIDVTVNNVTIRGAPGHVIIDCLGQRRHFTIWGEHVTVDGLNLVRGSAPFGECTGKNLQCPEEPNGGCILVLGNHASIRNSIFSECTASLCGGAIAVLNDNYFLHMYSVTFLNNAASSGGAVSSYGDIWVNNCTFSFNTAELNGGAICLLQLGASLDAQQTSFTNNVASYGNGGSIAMVQSNVSTSCNAQPPSHTGSIYLSDGVLVHNNSAGQEGGAIFVQAAALIWINGYPDEVRIVKNSAYVGGAILVGSYGALNISGRVTLQGNAAVSVGGGAVYCRCFVQGSLSGAVVFAENAASTADAGYGGAIFANGYSRFVVTGNVTFSRNTAPLGMAGACYAQFSSVFVVSESVLFVDNIAGGAMASSSNSLLDISGDVRFVDNSADWYGGAIYSQLTSDTKVHGSASFEGNRVLNLGGAIYLGGPCSVYLSGRASFSRNSASVAGGAIHLDYGPHMEAEGSVAFFGNVGGELGGAIDAQGSSVRLGGGVLVQNNSAGAGGGLSLRSRSLLALRTIHSKSCVANLTFGPQPSTSPHPRIPTLFPTRQLRGDRRPGGQRSPARQRRDRGGGLCCVQRPHVRGGWAGSL